MRVLAVTACAMFACARIASAEDQFPLAEAEAKQLIQSLTRIGVCIENPPFNFLSIKTAPPHRSPVNINDAQAALYPVRAKYAVDCTRGNHNMKYGEVEELHIEVSATFSFYRDAFGEWRLLDARDVNDQPDVNCTSRRTAYLTYDPDGKVINRRPVDQAGACSVRAVERD
jgi:hypothetical protein